MKSSLCILVFCLFVSPGVFAQTQPAPKPAESLKPNDLVEEWFKRVNNLSDWFISFDGKELTDPVVNSLLDLYDPAAIQFVGPDQDQIGSLTFSTKEEIRKWADRLARDYLKITYRLSPRSADEKTATVFYQAQPPWGGLSVSAEFTAAYTERDSGRRFMVPGAIFIDFKQDGKIRRLRIYMVKDEAKEIFGYDTIARL